MKLAIFMFLLVDLLVFSALDHWGPFHFSLGDGRVATLALPWQKQTHPDAPPVVKVYLPEAASMSPINIAPAGSTAPPLKKAGPTMDQLLSEPQPANTVIYKCRDASGGVLFQDTPCAKK
ncbi:hypothetical protein HNQ50_001436 [Silvimonas terrae]|uniref:DUF4124 domain-containing protein n=1 Tax=Silvimonas terrae TaxID=300266 RepID=A0A840RDP8_9NEIS|nr:DUF4124 domain-containing protein [Silvimonas terrae]MBB5190714.1 hypothetical protein [Silvimonas terrae]